MTKIEEVLNRLHETIEAGNKLSSLIAALEADIIGLPAPPAPAPAPAPAPPAPAPAPAPAPPAPPAELIMTAAANGVTYAAYMATPGWTDQMLIDQGLATAPTPPPPAPAPPITPEELNTIMVTEFNRLGDRAPIDAELKKLGATGVSELPVEKYQELIDNVKALVKVA